VNTIYLF